jgi:predicted alpha/beta hydrolase
VKQSEVTIAAADGYRLSGTLFEPDSPSRRPAVVHASATGVKRGFYEAYARHLTGEGMTVLTFDYRGIGGSRPASLRGFHATMRDWGEKDLDAAISWLAARRPDDPIALTGHSVGGQLAGFASNRTRLVVMQFVASQSGYWRHWTGPRKPIVALIWHAVIPAFTHAFGYMPSGWLGLGEDLPKGVALEWARWGRSRNYIMDHVDERTRDGYRSVAAPLRALSFTDDELYAPKAAVAHLLSFYSGAPREWIHLDPGDRGLRSIGHWGFFRSRAGEALWPETVEWLKSAAI